MTPVVAGMVWLLLALVMLCLQVRVASGRFTAHPDPGVRQEMKRWMSSPFNRWSAVFLSASCLIGAWFARGQGALAVLALLSGAVFAAGAWLGWRTRRRLDSDGAAKPHDARNGPARRWVSAVPLGVTGMFFVLASQAIRGTAGDGPSTTAAVVFTIAMFVGLVLLVAAGFAAFKASTEKAQRDYLDNR